MNEMIELLIEFKNACLENRAFLSVNFLTCYDGIMYSSCQVKNA